MTLQPYSTQLFYFDVELNLKAHAERTRMLGLISTLQAAHADGRGVEALTSGKVEQLKNLQGQASDRPAHWINNILCRFHGLCAAPYTGGDGSAPKVRIVRSKPSPAPEADLLQLKPNPAMNWVAIDHLLPDGIASGSVRIIDLTGKPLINHTLGNKLGQSVIQLGEFAPGAYMVQLLHDGEVLEVERLIVR